MKWKITSNCGDQVPVECNCSTEKWQNVHISIAQEVALFVVWVRPAISIYIPEPIVHLVLVQDQSH